MRLGILALFLCLSGQDEITLQWEQWRASLGQQFSEFERFVSGSLPAVGLGGLGLLTGFRKR